MAKAGHPGAELGEWRRGKQKDHAQGYALRNDIEMRIPLRRLIDGLNRKDVFMRRRGIGGKWRRPFPEPSILHPIHSWE